MAKFRYFADINGETHELTSVQYRGRKAFGFCEAFPEVFVQGQGWTGGVYATRVIEMKAFPSRHVCDARCMHAQGKTMRCECSCGGKNHGRGSFVADEPELAL